jgi:hypothetical protein
MVGERQSKRMKMKTEGAEGRMDKENERQRVGKEEEESEGGRRGRTGWLKEIG